MSSFANALRQLPSIIAENGGYDSAQLVSELKAENMLGLELADQLSRVISSVLSNDGGQLSKSICKAGHSSGLLARGYCGQLIHSPCHQQLRAAAPIEGPWLLHSGSENAQCVMKTPLRFSDDLLRCSSEDNAASLTEGDSTELQ